MCKGIGKTPQKILHFVPATLMKLKKKQVAPMELLKMLPVILLQTVCSYGANFPSGQTVSRN
jgi:hypothetical protein